MTFQDVGTQAVVTEYLVRYVDLIFNDKIPTFSHSTNGVEGTPKKSRPKSLAISTPTKLISIEEARSRALNTAIKQDQKYIDVGKFSGSYSDSLEFMDLLIGEMRLGLCWRQFKNLEFPL